MTFWAKVLTVVVFVLSLVFASMSAVVFAKREAYRKLYVTEQEKHVNDVTTLNKTVTDLGTRIDTLQADVQNTKFLLESTKKDLDASTKKVAELTDTVAEKNRQITAEQANVTLLTSSNTELTKNNQALTQDNDKLRVANRDFQDKLATEQKLTRELTAKVTELTETGDKLKADLKEANDTIALNNEVFAELQKRNIEARTVIAGLQNVPSIKARVLTVDPTTNTVVLNVGSKQGVRKNFEFSIFRESKFVAKVNVFDTDKNGDLCAARIVLSEAPVKTGDQAWTRLR